MTRSFWFQNPTTLPLLFRAFPNTLNFLVNAFDGSSGIHHASFSPCIKNPFSVTYIKHTYLLTFNAESYSLQFIQDNTGNIGSAALERQLAFCFVFLKASHQKSRLFIFKMNSSLFKMFFFSCEIFQLLVSEFQFIYLFFWLHTPFI